MLVNLFLGLWLVALLRPAFGDVDFLSVRTSLNTDYSGFQGRPGSKYFREYPLRLNASAVPKVNGLEWFSWVLKQSLTCFPDR